MSSKRFDKMKHQKTREVEKSSLNILKELNEQVSTAVAKYQTNTHKQEQLRRMFGDVVNMTSNPFI